MSWQLLLVCLLAVPVVVVSSIRFQRESNRAYLHVRDRIGQTLSRLQEGISGVRVIQAYGRQEVEVERFVDQNRGLYDAHMRSVRAQAWYLPVIEFAGLGTTALVVGLGGWMTIEGVVTIGTIAFFLLTLNNLFEPVQQLSQLFNMLQSAGAALQKLFELLDTPVDVPERRDAVELAPRGEVVVDHVSFGYGETPVLHDVSLVIAPGERLALVGPTGAGKSTLAKLVARLYDPTEGVVRFGGVDLRQATHTSLRQRIVVVPQEGFLFHGTIRDNVRVAGRARPTRRWTRRWPTSACSSGSRPCPTGSTPRSTNGAPGLSAGRSSWCRWRGPRWWTRRCWCWTRPPPASTRVPSAWWSPPWTASCPAAPWW